MNDVLNKAKEILESNQYTWVMIKDGKVYTSNENGVKPIIKPLNQDVSFFVGGWVADRVIGKSAAMLLAKGNVHGIYGEVISQHALDFLSKTNIDVAYGKLVPFIENRTQDGICPLEQSVLNIEDLDEAHNAVNATIDILMGKNK